MKRAVLVLSSVGLLAFAAVACGGANDSELFDAPGSSQFGTEPTPSGTGTGTAPSGSSSNGSSGASTSSSSSSSGSSTSSSSGGSSTSSSSSSSSSSGGSTSSSSSGGSSGTTWKSPGIYCGQDNAGGDLYCQSGTTVCCIGRFDNFGSQCKPLAQGCPPQAIALKCNDETDCPGGQVCCAQFDQQSGYKSAQCQTSCSGSSNGTVAVKLCDPDAPTDQCLSTGKTCQPSSSLSGYSICK